MIKTGRCPTRIGYGRSRRYRVIFVARPACHRPARPLIFDPTSSVLPNANTEIIVPAFNLASITMPQLPKATSNVSTTSSCCRAFCVISLVAVVSLQTVRLGWDAVGGFSSSTSPAALKADATTLLARHESLGFMTDVPETEWRLQKQKVRDMYPNVKGGDISVWLQNNSPISAGTFFQEHFEPDFACRHERRLGLLGDGGKWVCDPHRLPATCLVYSVGSNGETSFEAAIRRTAPQCEIHTFDPEPGYKRVVEQSGSHFHAWGISHATTTNPHDNKAYKTLKETMAELGHTGRSVDIFKIDCEGCEWTVAPSLLEADLRQILIELHSVRDSSGSNNHKMPMPTTVQFFDNMYKHGYVIFHKEPNIQYWDYQSCVEYGFLKLHPDFLFT
jgi:Methyltransferase domain